MPYTMYQHNVHKLTYLLLLQLILMICICTCNCFLGLLSEEGDTVLNVIWPSCIVIVNILILLRNTIATYFTVKVLILPLFSKSLWHTQTFNLVIILVFDYQKTVYNGRMYAFFVHIYSLFSFNITVKCFQLPSIFKLNFSSTRNT